MLRSTTSPAYQWGAMTLFLASGVILLALGFEFIGGFEPCPLCLQQRWAYYVGIPATFLALVLLTAGHPRAAAVLFAAVALAYFANAGLGSYHAGAEWGFWPGPETCAATADTRKPGASLLEELQRSRVVRCDEAAGRLFGLSFAGWNVVASLMLCITSLKAAFASRDHETYL
jgi:disulfide bond formation protein DsbB